MKSLVRVCIALLALTCCQGAAAHARSESYSTWQVNGAEIRGVITVSSAEVISLVDSGNTRPLNELLAGHVEQTVRVRSQAGDCPMDTPAALRAARGFIRIETSFHCGDEVPASLHYRALFDRLPAHIHYARIVADDGPPAEILFTDRANDGSLTQSVSRSPAFMAFLDLGVRHILGGIDHIAFLLGMLLVSGTFLRGVTAVTGFTVGHSLSLAAAVLGFVEADSRLVEAFIGFTVALLAIEYFLLSRPSASRLAWMTLWVAWGGRRTRRHSRRDIGASHTRLPGLRDLLLLLPACGQTITWRRAVHRAHWRRHTVRGDRLFWPHSRFRFRRLPDGNGHSRGVAARALAGIQSWRRTWPTRTPPPRADCVSSPARACPAPAGAHSGRRPCRYRCILVYRPQPRYLTTEPC